MAATTGALSATQACMRCNNGDQMEMVTAGRQHHQERFPAPAEMEIDSLSSLLLATQRLHHDPVSMLAHPPEFHLTLVLCSLDLDLEMADLRTVLTEVFVPKFMWITIRFQMSN
ncbi:hypothetical protein E4U55_001902 [Claviceps digitariae]|nr:hypothetical protein E4U55_001902 [Claviceps digitariae]